MTKLVKQVKPVTPPNTSKRALARLKIRERKHGGYHGFCSKQRWDAETRSWVSLWRAKTINWEDYR